MKKSTAVATSIAVTAVATAAISGLITWIAWPTKDPKADLGDLPTWISAVMAILAFAGLVVTAIYAARIYRIESERDEQAAKERRSRDEAERQAQAEKVAAWFAQNQSGAMLGGTLYAAYARNASELPIYEVRISFHPVRRDPVGENHIGPIRVTSDPRAVIAPGEQVLAAFPLADSGVTAESVNPETFAASLKFRDAAGVQWERDPYGKLTELASS